MFVVDEVSLHSVTNLSTRMGLASSGRSLTGMPQAYTALRKLANVVPAFVIPPMIVKLLYIVEPFGKIHFIVSKPAR